MTGWAADRYITPRVIDHLAAHLADVPVKNRPAFPAAQCVLRALARWARREPGGEHAGMWLADDTVGQLQAQTGLADGTIRNALAALERVGLTVTLSNGGGRGLTARGATRRLVLDPIDVANTARAKHAEYEPKLRGVDPAEYERKLRGVRGETPRGTSETPRGQPRDTASSAFYYVDRAPADAADVHTAPPPTDDPDAAERARIAYANYVAGMRDHGAEPLPPRAYWLSHPADMPDVWAEA